MNEVIENYLRTGETDIAEPYASLMKEAAVSYVQEIFQKLKDYEYNESLMQLHFMGGGARTAKGYEYYCYMILRHSQIPKRRGI